MEFEEVGENIVSFFMMIGLIFILPVVFIIETIKFLRE